MGTLRGRVRTRALTVITAVSLGACPESTWSCLLGIKPPAAQFQSNERSERSAGPGACATLQYAIACDVDQPYDADGDTAGSSPNSCPYSHHSSVPLSVASWPKRGLFFSTKLFNMSRCATHSLHQPRPKSPATPYIEEPNYNIKPPAAHFQSANGASVQQPQMRVPEPGPVLQPIAQQAIECNVDEPNQPQHRGL